MLISCIFGTRRGDLVASLSPRWGEFAGETHFRDDGEILATVIYVGF